MSIVYLKLNISLNRLNIKTEEEMVQFLKVIEDIIREEHPAGYFNIQESDVEVEIEEYAGTLENKGL